MSSDPGDRQFLGDIRRLEDAQRLIRVAAKLGGVERLPAGMRADLNRALGHAVVSPLRPRPRTRLRLVVDNTHRTSTDLILENSP
jgi:hypothetical protein